MVEADMVDALMVLGMASTEVIIMTVVDILKGGKVICQEQEPQ